MKNFKLTDFLQTLDDEQVTVYIGEDKKFSGILVMIGTDYIVLEADSKVCIPYHAIMAVMPGLEPGERE